MSALKIKIPEAIKRLYTSTKRYILLFGGRGSGKSWSVADFLILKAYESKKRILCTREVQKSLEVSVQSLLLDRIEVLGLSSFFHVTKQSIVGDNGSEFVFKGLRNNPTDIKSIHNIAYCWVEEAEKISNKSIEILTPSIRAEDQKVGFESQIIFSYNPTDKTDPVHTMFNLSDREDVERIEVNYHDNPFFPNVLRKEMEYDKRTDYDKYLHKWEGQCVAHSQAQIFYNKWVVEEHEAPEGAWFYFGADWGFSQDPSTLIRCYVLDRTLYIDYEFYEVGVEIDHLPERFKGVPESQNYPSRGDSARPDTISYMKRHGFPKMRSSKKGKGSIIDGIEHIRSYERIVIHPRCIHTIDEFRLYCYVVNEITGEVSNKIRDKYNHIIDALRYALEDIMRHKRQIQSVPDKNLTQLLGW